MLQRRRRQLVRLASGHSRTPRTGAQDEAHRLNSDFELSLGAQGGAVCFSNLEAPVSLLLLHLSFRYNEEPCVPATLQQVCDIHTRPSYQPLTHGRKGPTGLNAPCSLQTRPRNVVAQLGRVWPSPSCVIQMKHGRSGVCSSGDHCGPTGHCARIFVDRWEPHSFAVGTRGRNFHPAENIQWSSAIASNQTKKKEMLDSESFSCRRGTFCRAPLGCEKSTRPGELV